MSLIWTLCVALNASGVYGGIVYRDKTWLIVSIFGLICSVPLAVAGLFPH